MANSAIIFAKKFRLRWVVEPRAFVGLGMSLKGHRRVLKNQEVKNVQDHCPDIINNQGLFSAVCLPFYIIYFLLDTLSFFYKQRVKLATSLRFQKS